MNFITGKQGLLCVTETWRYGYIQDYGDRVETPHGTTIGCEKSSNGLKKEDFSTFIDSFEINTPRQLFIQPCVTKTERYGYIWNYGGCVEPSHRTTIGCEKG